MKAIILAAGFGTRLGNVAKPLIKIAGKEIIRYTIEQINSIDFIDTIYIATNKKYYNDFLVFTDSIESIIDKKIELISNKAMTDAEKLGTVGDLGNVIKKKKINEDLLIALGDNIYDENYFKKFVNYFYSNNNLIGYEKKPKEEIKKTYGNLVLNSENKVIELYEKPESPKTELAVVGIYGLKKENITKVLHYLNLEEVKEKKEKRDAIGFFIEWFYKNADLYAYPMKRYDIGLLDSLKKTKKVFEK